MNEKTQRARSCVKFFGQLIQIQNLRTRALKRRSLVAMSGLVSLVDPTNIFIARSLPLLIRA
ncbi:hypothetical protein A6770_35165 [Nostoc minutum NIES-26]|uniref:Uncharacterized protein n=1 Tax=Nostoc minutum NIES-26 TaxID=1844469 RepID=A0A367S0E4_9NOSO|nr:hypothetical protein A6770_35165 [Nostoc minutum NIES-26]